MSAPPRTREGSRPLADLVDAKVRLFVEALAHHQDAHAAFRQCVQRAHEVSADVVQAAQAERLDHQPAIVRFPHKAQHVRRGAGHELEQKHARVDAVPKGQVLRAGGGV